MIEENVIDDAKIMLSDEKEEKNLDEKITAGKFWLFYFFFLIVHLP